MLQYFMKKKNIYIRVFKGCFRFMGVLIKDWVHLYHYSVVVYTDFKDTFMFKEKRTPYTFKHHVKVNFA